MSNTTLKTGHKKLPSAADETAGSKQAVKEVKLVGSDTSGQWSVALSSNKPAITSASGKSLALVSESTTDQLKLPEPDASSNRPLVLAPKSPTSKRKSPKKRTTKKPSVKTAKTKRTTKRKAVKATAVKIESPIINGFKLKKQFAGGLNKTNIKTERPIISQVIIEKPTIDLTLITNVDENKIKSHLSKDWEFVDLGVTPVEMSKVKSSLKTEEKIVPLALETKVDRRESSAKPVVTESVAEYNDDELKEKKTDHRKRSKNCSTKQIMLTAWKWLRTKNLSNQQKMEIINMTYDETKKAFNVLHELKFGTAGIRGEMGMGPCHLNSLTYRQIAIGYAKYILSLNKNKKFFVVIGHDNRKNSADFALVCADTLVRYGINVLLFEKNILMPTPIISYAIIRSHATGGINITASHNPKQDNGFKAYNSSGAQVLPDEAEIIAKNMPSIDDVLEMDLNARPITGKITYLNYKSLILDYFNDLKRNVIINPDVFKRSNLKFPIVFTAHHGTTCKLMADWLRFLGFRKIYLVKKQCFVDSDFPNSPISNPEVEESFAEAIKVANKVHSNIVFAADPDGDRMAIGFRQMDGSWKFMNGNEMGIIYTYYCLRWAKYTNPYIISTHVSTNYVDLIAEKYGAKVYRTKTGFKWIGNKVNELIDSGDFVVGFEEAIGALNTICNRDKDSFGAIAMALEIYCASNNYYLDLFDLLRHKIFAEFGDNYSKTNSYTITSRDWESDAQDLMNIVQNVTRKELGGYSIEQIRYNPDGDCVEWLLDKNSWIKFRISGTEPKFKVYFCLNGDTYNNMRSDYEKITNFIQSKILKNFSYR